LEGDDDIKEQSKKHWADTEHNQTLTDEKQQNNEYTTKSEGYNLVDGPVTKIQEK